MAENELKIILTGDPSGLEQATAKASKALNNVKQASGSAQFALTNLSRVASDAPFGFIAIQNNLDPLIQSFGQLKTQTGSVGGAFQALGSSLIGPAGIGLAFSVVSSLITAFQLGVFDSGKKTKDAAKEIKEGFDIIREASANSQGEISKVDSLSKVVLDLSKSYKERNNALNELKKINENYFGGFTLEESSLKKLKTATEEYTNAIVAQAVVKGFEQEISKVSQELFKQREELVKLSKDYEFYNNARNTAAANSKTERNSISQTNSQFQAYDNLLIKTTNDLEKQKKVVTETQKQYSNLQAGIQQAIDESLKFKPLDKPKTDNSAKQRAEQLAKEEEELKKFWERVNRAGVEAALKFKSEENKIWDQKNKEKIANALKEEQDGYKQMEADAAASATEQASKFKIWSDAFVEANKKMVELGQSIINQLSPAFTDLFDNILSGSKNALQAFGQAIAGVIKKLIAAAITAAIFAAIVSVAFPGAAAGGASFAKNFIPLFSQLSGLKMASGGIVTGPTRALIGEAGPEAVIPLNKLDSIIGGNQNVFVTGVLSGETIYLQQQRTSARRARFA